MKNTNIITNLNSTPILIEILNKDYTFIEQNIDNIFKTVSLELEKNFNTPFSNNLIKTLVIDKNDNFTNEYIIVRILNCYEEEKFNLIESDYEKRNFDRFFEVELLREIITNSIVNGVLFVNNIKLTEFAPKGVIINGDINNYFNFSGNEVEDFISEKIYYDLNKIFDIKKHYLYERYLEKNSSNTKNNFLQEICEEDIPF